MLLDQAVITEVGKLNGIMLAYVCGEAIVFGSGGLVITGFIFLYTNQWDCAQVGKKKIQNAPLNFTVITFVFYPAK